MLLTPNAITQNCNTNFVGRFAGGFLLGMNCKGVAAAARAAEASMVSSRKILRVIEFMPAPGKFLTPMINVLFSTRVHTKGFYFLPAASALALAITSLIATGLPSLRLLSSAASMKANISMVSSGLIGATLVLKNFAISRHMGS